MTRFSKIKKGVYFSFPGKKKVYEFLGGGKKRGFNYVDTLDISAFHSTKTDRIINIDIEY